MISKAYKVKHSRWFFIANNNFCFLLTNSTRTVGSSIDFFWKFSPLVFHEVRRIRIASTIKSPSVQVRFKVSRNNTRVRYSALLSQYPGYPNIFQSDHRFVTRLLPNLCNCVNFCRVEATVACPRKIFAGIFVVWNGIFASSLYVQWICLKILLYVLLYPTVQK